MKRVHSKLSKINSLNLPIVDLDGRSKTVRVKIPASWVRDIDDWVNSPRSRYKNQAEFLRHAVYLLHRELSGKPDIERVLQEFDEWKKYYESVTTNLQSVVSFHLADGLPGGVAQARRFLIQMRQDISQLHDDYWRQHCLSYLDSRYGHLLDGTGPDYR